MSEKVKAVVFHAPGDVRVETVDAVDPGGGLRVQVEACAVCGSDLKTFVHGNPRIKPPMVMGHEFAGRVESPNGSEFPKGTRIVMATTISCGACFYCRRGWTNLCSDLACMGFHHPGGMAETVYVPKRALDNGHVVPVPEEVPPHHAALAEPVSCAVNACENAGVQSGDVVVVVGAGPMGVINACVARTFGASKVILSEVNPERLRQAEAFDLDRLVDPASEDLKEVVLKETGGLGADVVIVAAPAVPPQESAPELVRRRGTICLFASLPQGGHEIRLDSRRIHYGELRVVGTSDSTPAHVRKAVEIIASRSLQAERLVLHRLKLDDIHQAFDLMKKGEALRVVLEP
jgi:L-iditol 2-dehydrogenase